MFLHWATLSLICFSQGDQEWKLNEPRWGQERHIYQADRVISPLFYAVLAVNIAVWNRKGFPNHIWRGGGHIVPCDAKIRKKWSHHKNTA